MQRDRLPYILIPLVAFVAIHPLLVHGTSCGHDFDFHIVNWFEVAKQLRAGHYPQWAATPAWNAGEPRFVFYPPFSWLIGAILGMLMPWTWTPIAFTWIALSAAGFALYAAARNLNASRNAALLAAAVYTVNPYTLFTAWERTAYAELLAAAWLPLLLAGALRERPTILRVAIPVALLWLTNVPSAIMGCYALALVAVVRLIATLMRAPRQSRQLATVFVLGGVLGFGLAAFYILPAVYQRSWVQVRMAFLSGMRFSDNFLFYRTGDPDHDSVLYTASIVAIVMVALTLAALLFAFKRPQRGPGLPSLAILTLVIIFLLTPLSIPVWNHAPELPFLPFPWRLLAVLVTVFALALAQALPAPGVRITAIASLLIGFVCTVPLWHSFGQRCYPEDTVPTRLAIFLSANPGSEPTDEYTLIGADNDALAQNNPPWWLAANPKAAAPEPATHNPGPSPRALDLNLAEPQTLILNLRRYPAWRVLVDDTPASLAYRADGLIAIPLPAGPAHIRITWHNGKDRILGNSISIASLLLAAFLLFHKALRLESTENAQATTSM